MLFLIFSIILPRSLDNAAERLEFQVIGGTVYAFKAGTGEGYWNNDGMVYRESEEPSDSRPPFFVRNERLYAILASEDGRNVVIALDLRAEGRLVWRVKPERFGVERFEKFVSIRGDALKISGFDNEGDRKVVRLDVATGLDDPE